MPGRTGVMTHAEVTHLLARSWSVPETSPGPEKESEASYLKCELSDDLYPKIRWAWNNPCQISEGEVSSSIKADRLSTKLTRSEVDLPADLRDQ